jgi:hypothetical protein
MSGVATPAWYSTVAFSVARFTEARTTPGTSLRPRSILATHDAQDMPSIGIVSETGLPEAPATLLIPPPWRGRAWVRGSSFAWGGPAADFARIGIIMTICTGGGPMGLGPDLSTPAGSFSKVRLQPGAQK